MQFVTHGCIDHLKNLIATIMVYYSSNYFIYNYCTANFAHERYEEYASLITMIIGAMNITAAIISTIAQFCKVSEKVEGHRISSIFWDKFGRNIRIELTKDRKDRMKVEEFMKICQEEYNRLIEHSSIPRDIIRAFENYFIIVIWI